MSINFTELKKCIMVWWNRGDLIFVPAVKATVEFRPDVLLAVSLVPDTRYYNPRQHVIITIHESSYLLNVEVVWMKMCYDDEGYVRLWSSSYLHYGSLGSSLA
jgi:hypothetical protein